MIDCLKAFLHPIIRHITKLRNPSSYSPRVKGVHTDRHANFGYFEGYATAPFVCYNTLLPYTKCHQSCAAASSVCTVCQAQTQSLSNLSLSLTHTRTHTLSNDLGLGGATHEFLFRFFFVLQAALVAEAAQPAGATVQGKRIRI